MDPCAPRPSVGPCVPPTLERAIAARWNQWVPFVRMQLLRQHQSNPAVNPASDSADTRRLRQRHSELLIAMMRDGITMRTICRHRLDDVRLTDDVRTLMVRAAMERRRTAGAAPRGDLDTLLKLSNFAPAPPESSAAVSATEGQGRQESLQAQPQAPRDVTDPHELLRTIESIRQHVSQQFYLSEMRDPDLKVRSHRQAYAFPRQLAMYIARQATRASLAEIGRQFGGRHYSTVLHSINKIERMSRLDEELNDAITRLMDALQK